MKKPPGGGFGERVALGSVVQVIVDLDSVARDHHLVRRRALGAENLVGCSSRPSRMLVRDVQHAVAFGDIDGEAAPVSDEKGLLLESHRSLDLRHRLKTNRYVFRCPRPYGGNHSIALILGQR